MRQSGRIDAVSWKPLEIFKNKKYLVLLKLSFLNLLFVLCPETVYFSGEVKMQGKCKVRELQLYVVI